MMSGNLNLLCDIPISEIADRGIAYIRAKFEPVNLRVLFDEFWVYCSTTWLSLYKPEMWNVHAFKDCWEDIQNQSNNPIERFNREMNANLVKNPTMPDFIETVKKLSCDLVQKLADIASKKIFMPKRPEMGYLEISDDYYEFVADEY